MFEFWLHLVEHAFPSGTSTHPPPLIICFYLELSSPLYLLGHGGIWIPGSCDQPVSRRKAVIVSLSVTFVYVALIRIPWTSQAIISIWLNKECRNQSVKVLYSDSQFEQQREVKCDHAHPDHDYISLKTVPLIVTKYWNKDMLPNWLFIIRPIHKCQYLSVKGKGFQKTSRSLFLWMHMAYEILL